MKSLNAVFTLPAPLALGIPPASAHALSFAFAGAYVGSLYVAQAFFGHSAGTNTPSDNKNTNGPPPGDRNHPDTMRRRMKAVSIATRLCLTTVLLVVKNTGRYSFQDAILPTARLLGLSQTAYNVPLAFLLAPTLFIGPLYATWLDEQLPGQRNFGPLTFGLHEKRNYLVGPLTEELLFRSCTLAVSMLGGLSQHWLVFGTPLWFGLAHAHHAFQAYLNGDRSRKSAINASLACVFQMGYTTLFGWFASYLYLRTGSIVPPLFSHIFCNWMGIYGPGTAARNHPQSKLSIVAAYLAGIAGFVYTLPKL